MNKVFKKIALLLFATIIISSSIFTPASAVSMKGYFTGATQQYADGEHVINGGISTAVNSPSELMNTLKEKYSDGLYQDKVGVAFIVNTFIVNSDLDVTIDLTPKHWTEFEDLLNDYQDSQGIKWGTWLNLKDPATLNSINSLYSPSMKDDRFYMVTEDKGVNVIEFTNQDGSFAYALKYDCGNPVGAPNLIPPKPVPVVTTPEDTACRPIVITVPGHENYRKNAVSVKFWIVDNDKVDDDTKQKKIVFEKTYRKAADHDENFTILCTTGDTYTAYYDIAEHKHGRDSKDDPPADKLETFGPCYDYLLKSSISSLSNYQVEVGSTIQITPSITNSSWTQSQQSQTEFWNKYKTSTRSKATEWQISRLKVDSDGDTIPTIAATSTETVPCSFYNKAKGFSKCTAEKTGKDIVLRQNSTNTMLDGGNPTPSFSLTIGDEEAGTKICFALSVRAVSSEGSSASNNNESATASNVWYHSAVAKNVCVIVVKKPKVQVLGGDIKVGRSFSSTNSYLTKSNILTINSVKTINGKLTTYGSWAEYALAAPGLIRGMASGSAFNGGMAADVSLGVTATCKYRTLSFSNSNSTAGCSSSTTIGSYSFNKKTIPDISSSFSLNNITNVISSGKLDNVATGAYKTTGDITITGGNLSAGKWIVINAPTATVKITGDVTYTTDKLKNISDIPQLVIIAKNIQISNSVGQVDAWLIAKDGTLNTCSEKLTGALSTGDCNKLLTINGPVMASELRLRRTSGSDAGALASGAPAEVFNLRADAYLWAYARATGSGRVWTVYTTNVPPRL